MAVLGILSIVQAAFLPGFLLVRGCGAGRGVIQTIVLSFGVSLLLNHLLVFALVACESYRPPVMYAVFATEVIAAVALCRKDISAPVSALLAGERGAIRQFVTRLDALPDGIRSYGWICVVFGALAFIASAIAVLANATHVFVEWDAVVSWNKWAVEWSSNQIPTRTWNYPQLLPTTYSLTYAFTSQSQVVFFAKFLAGLFVPMLLLALADLAVRLRDAAYAAAMAVSLFLLYFVLGPKVFSGYADAPVASYAFLMVYCLLLAGEETSVPTALRYVFVAAICGAGVASTKQAGWIPAIAFPFLAYGIAFSGVVEPVKRRVAWVLGAWILLVGLAAPWYVYRHFFPAGSELEYVTNTIHQGRSIPARFLYGFQALTREGATGRTVILCVTVMLMLASAANRRWRPVTMLVTLPGFLAWGAFFSYSGRNLAIVLPFVAVACSIGAAEVVARSAALISKASLAGRYGVLKATAVCVGGLICLQGAISDEYLRRKQGDQQARIYDAEINGKLYEFHESHGFDGPVLSNYQIMGHLPKLQQWYVLEQFHDADEVVEKIANTAAAFLFVARFGEECDAFIDEELADGRLRVMFTSGKYTLYRINDRDKRAAP